ncbi:hypothetical protein [Acidovorax radicis]|nr:hypothetical protein [Acidovorax radicis]UCV00031.1 hypothetical protein KI609_04380 [Acidovorax radicis]
MDFYTTPHIDCATKRCGVARFRVHGVGVFIHPHGSLAVHSRQEVLFAN